jgi:pyruvate/2-oxoglutarate dehydrogenase complex dihydrolipoamide acyltransferase (E2) component
MSIDVTMPQMGESVVEGTIAKWLVKEGDVVVEDQPLVEISTDKVDTEIPSPGAGRIAKIVAAEGQTLPVGATLAVIEPAGAEAPAKLKVVAPKASPKPEPIQPKPAPLPARPAPAPQPAPMQAAGAGLREAEPEPGGARRFSPVVLKIAAEEGIDLSRVSGTGIGGRVSKRDLQRYLDSLRKGGTPAAATPTATNGVAQTSSRPATSPAAVPLPPAQTSSSFKPPVYAPAQTDRRAHGVFEDAFAACRHRGGSGRYQCDAPARET